MGVFYETIPDSLIPWIHAQHLLLVGTAPLSGDGHINISPKGCSASKNFGVIDSRTFWYLDLTGSGVETHAHLYEPGNGRICIMFMAFIGPPRIVRLWGSGTVLENGSEEFAAFVHEKKVEIIPGARSIMIVDIHQCATSCGYSVPYYDFVKHRTTLDEHFAKKKERFEKGKEEESMDNYWAFKSQLSIDGLPGMKRGVDFARRNNVKPLVKMVGPYAPGRPRTVTRVEVWHLLVGILLGVVIGAAGALSLVSPEVLGRVQRKEGFGF